MKHRMKTIIGILLALAVAVSLTGCSRKPAAPQPTEAPEKAVESVTWENGGVKLTIPAEYADLVIVETPSDGERLFSVTEKASLEAAQKTRPDNTDGAGWLFGISRVSEEPLCGMLCYDMIGQQVFARDGEEYYLLDTPTDVRIEREGEITQSDMEQWGALYEWIMDPMTAGFIEDNGLTACRYSNTGLDMLLARIAWGGKTDYSLASLDYGELFPQGAESAAYAEELLNAGAFVFADGEEAPDGEYFVLNDKSDGTRYDIFKGGEGRYVREVHEEYEILYRSTTGADLADIMDRWCAELDALDPVSYDRMAYQVAVDAVLEEYAALDQNGLENYDETEHPELPWYTAAIANPVRNSLYYGFYDFDANDVPELVIAAGGDTWQQPMGVYAFDGSKMVYLCSEQALGERTTVSFLDGEFVVRASGGAAVGGVTVYAIAPDGFGTEVLAAAEYEYDAAGSVTLTPTRGEMTNEQFEEYMSRTGEFPTVEYTRFAPGAGEGMTGMINPWSEAATAEEAAQGAGLDLFVLPEVLVCFPGGAPDPVLRYMEGLAEAVYTDGTNTLVLRKGVGDEDVSGDYNSYPETWETNWKGLMIQCAGDSGQARRANWYFGGNAYSLTFNVGAEELPGLEEHEVTSIVNQIQ